MPKKKNVFVVIGGGLWLRGSKGWKWAKKNLVVHRKRKPKPKPRPFHVLQGVDGVSVPSGAQLKAIGKHFVGRYISTPGNPKNLTKDEVADFHKNGIGIVIFFETTGTTFMRGHAAGLADAKLAREQLAALGVPGRNKDGSRVAVFFAVDTDPTGKGALISAYAKGLKQGMGATYAVGLYGGYGTVEAGVGVADYFVQAYAWSGGKWHPAAKLQQYRNAFRIGNHTVDLDRQVKPNAGIWLP